MKYDAFIDQVHKNVREDSAWPSSSSAGQEQVDLALIAALAVMGDVPLARLSVTESTLSGTALVGTTQKYALPANIIHWRGDLGFDRLEIDNYSFLPHQFLSPESVIAAGENSFQSDRVFVAFDRSGRVLYISGNPTTVTYFGALAPTKPAPADTDTEDYPLDNLEAERAVQIVSMHVNGVTIRDSAASQFNALLEKQYSGAQNG